MKQLLSMILVFTIIAATYSCRILGKSEEYRLTQRAGFLVAVSGKIFAKNRRSFTICLQLKEHLSSLLRTDRAGVPCYNKAIK